MTTLNTLVTSLRHTLFTLTFSKRHALLLYKSCDNQWSDGLIVRNDAQVLNVPKVCFCHKKYDELLVKERANSCDIYLSIFTVCSSITTSITANNITVSANSNTCYEDRGDA